MAWSQRERDRLPVLHEVEQGQVAQIEAARRMKLTDRRGTFGSVKELVAKIEYFVHRYNAEARPFSWTATPDSILEKFQRLCERISGTQH